MPFEALNPAMQPLKFCGIFNGGTHSNHAACSARRNHSQRTAPEKYALHKLLVYVERRQNMRLKASKDLAQAASLIDYLGKMIRDCSARHGLSLSAAGLVGEAGR